MKSIKHLEKTINETYKIVEDNLGEKTHLKERKEELINSLQEGKFIKVPFVGDFSAGKSSLVNTLLEIDILPTDITPETAISYELFFSENERLELFRTQQLTNTYKINEIKEINTKPGDIVKIHLNNPKVKEWNNNGILIVDMPGIDSGIQEHNDAIMNYIEEGTVFVVAVDVEQGTLRESSISFLKEIKKYNLSSVVVITKTDKKPQSEVIAVKELISKQIKTVLGDQTPVVTTSAIDKEIKDIENALSNLDAEKIAKEKHNDTVINYINNAITTIDTEKKLLSIDKTKFEEKKEKLKKSFEKALKDLEESKNKLQSVESSAEDVLQDVKSELEKNSRSLAQTLLHSKKDTTAFNASVMSIIRPVIINSLGREQEEYIKGLAFISKEFKSEIDDIIKDGVVFDTITATVNPEVIKTTIQNLVKTKIAQLLAKTGGRKVLAGVLGGIASVATPIVGIAVAFLTEALFSLFKKSDEVKINEMEEKFKTKVIVDIISKLRPSIEEAVSKQQETILQAVESAIVEENEKLKAEIEKVQKEEQKSEEELKTLVTQYNNSINSLEKLKSEL